MRITASKFSAQTSTEDYNLHSGCRLSRRRVGCGTAEAFCFDFSGALKTKVLSRRPRPAVEEPSAQFTRTSLVFVGPSADNQATMRLDN